MAYPLQVAADAKITRQMAEWMSAYFPRRLKRRNINPVLAIAIEPSKKRPDGALLHMCLQLPDDSHVESLAICLEKCAALLRGHAASKGDDKGKAPRT